MMDSKFRIDGVLEEIEEKQGRKNNYYFLWVTWTGNVDPCRARFFWGDYLAANVGDRVRLQGHISTYKNDKGEFPTLALNDITILDPAAVAIAPVPESEPLEMVGPDDDLPF